MKTISVLFIILINIEAVAQQSVPQATSGSVRQPQPKPPRSGTSGSGSSGTSGAGVGMVPAGTNDTPVYIAANDHSDAERAFVFTKKTDELIRLQTAAISSLAKEMKIMQDRLDKLEKTRSSDGRN